MPQPAKNDGPRILLFDIETAPALVWVWNQWNTNVIATEADWYILCFAYRWYGEDETHFVSIYQDPRFRSDTTNDKFVVKRLHEVLDEADVVIAHNGDAFDIRKTNARFIYYGMDPVSPYTSIDTKKESQRYLANYSNSLKELARLHDLTRKMENEGFSLWRRCMAGNSEAWKTMETYNRTDIIALEEWYVKLIPWIGHPGKGGGVNQALWGEEGATICPKCGARDTLIKRGFHRTKVSVFQTMQCMKKRGGCGGYSRARKREPQGKGGVAVT
jgi:hypothetical protein